MYPVKKAKLDLRIQLLVKIALFHLNFKEWENLSPPVKFNTRQ
jgi:hypothetical protein